MAISKIGSNATGFESDLTITDGDLLFATAAKGVVLGATSNTDANTIDDYEEGTWTPAAKSYSGTPSFSEATYTKVGRMVYVHCQVTFDSTTDSSRAVITGIPFTVTNTAGTALFYSGNPPDSVTFLCQTNSGENKFSGGKGTDLTYTDVASDVFRISSVFITS